MFPIWLQDDKKKKKKKKQEKKKKDEMKNYVWDNVVVCQEGKFSTFLLCLFSSIVILYH